MTRTEAQRISAEFCAMHAYYMCLADQAERATCGERPAPLVPPLEELQVVDGWVVWNGHPVWSPTDEALTRAQPTRARWTPSMANAAYNEAKEQDLKATRIHLQRARERVGSSNASSESKAFRLAKIAYLDSLVEQQQRAVRGEIAAPEIPARGDKMELVDGWLMWKDQPVWWAGERAGHAAPAVAARPAEASADAPAPVRQRPRLRRLLALPWRRAAASRDDPNPGAHPCDPRSCR